MQPHDSFPEGDDGARLEELLQVAREATQIAAELALPWRERADQLLIEQKTGPHDLVSQADREVEDAVRAVVARRRPADGVLGEGGGESAGLASGSWPASLDVLAASRAVWEPLRALLAKLYSDAGAPRVMNSGAPARTDAGAPALRAVSSNLRSNTPCSRHSSPSRTSSRHPGSRSNSPTDSDSTYI